MRNFLITAGLAIGASATKGNCPLHTVMDLLDKMNAKITAEGQEAERVHKESVEWCRSTTQDSEHNLERNAAAIEQFSALLEKSSATISAKSASITELAAKIAQETDERDVATALRAKQRKDFEAGQAEIEGTVDQLVRAAGILRKAGLGGAAPAELAQVTASLTTVLDAGFINADDRSKLQSLLQSASGEDDDGFSQPQAHAYESHSGSIIDVLSELKVKAEAELSDLRKDEMERQHAFDLLKQGLTDSIKTAEADRNNDQSVLKQAEESKGKNSGDLASEKESKATNEAFLADTTSECAKKAEDFAAASKSRAEEMAALAQAENILRDAYKGAIQEFKAGGTHKEFDDELSFLQVLSPATDARAQAVALIRDVARKYRDVSLAQLAARARDDTFGKVKGLIRSMINRLQKQAAEEADHNAYCTEERKGSTTKRDQQQGKLDGFSARLEKAEANSAKLKEDIAALSGEVAELDSSMAEATKVRQQEASDYAHNAEGFRIGTEGLSKAISVLREYYAANGDHNKKTDSAGGIIAMLETLLQDVSNCQAASEMAETNAQQAYDKMMQEGKVNKAQKQATSKAKAGELARLTESVSDLGSDVDGAQQELDATLGYLEKLKGMCEHKPQSFADRAAKRQDEIAGLKQALEILNAETAGAFLQRA